jgi:ubiquinone biosynthesis monooxygenase Coq7
MSQLSLSDKLLCEIDTALRTLIVPKHRSSNRVNPGEVIPEQSLSVQEKAHVAGLMRVNHAGEVCAQALYQGQALTAQLTEVKAQMIEAAAQEVDHLAWCEQRLCELGSQPSILNPLWYGGSLVLGALAGLAGDKWSLGFVAETERQVTKHLQIHQQHLPLQDIKTKAILAKMQDDEEHHAEVASAAGAAELPFFIKKLMQGVSKLLTKTSYYI